MRWRRAISLPAAWTTTPKRLGRCCAPWPKPCLWGALEPKPKPPRHWRGPRPGSGRRRPRRPRRGPQKKRDQRRRREPGHATAAAAAPATVASPVLPGSSCAGHLCELLSPEQRLQDVDSRPRARDEGQHSLPRGGRRGQRRESIRKHRRRRRLETAAGASAAVCSRPLRRRHRRSSYSLRPQKWTALLCGAPRGATRSSGGAPRSRRRRGT